MKDACRKPRRSVFDVVPGKEEEFRYLERSLALSDWLDRLIEVTEPQGQSEPVPALTAVPDPLSVSSRQRESGRDAMWDRIYVDEKLRELERERLARHLFIAEREREAKRISRPIAAGGPRGLRAGFASRLARLALTLDREAAAEAGLHSETGSPR